MKKTIIVAKTGYAYFQHSDDCLADCSGFGDEAYRGESGASVEEIVDLIEEAIGQMDSDIFRWYGVTSADDFVVEKR